MKLEGRVSRAYEYGRSCPHSVFALVHPNPMLDVAISGSYTPLYSC